MERGSAHYIAVETVKGGVEGPDGLWQPRLYGAVGRRGVAVAVFARCTEGLPGMYELERRGRALADAA